MIDKEILETLPLVMKIGGTACAIIINYCAISACITWDSARAAEAKWGSSLDKNKPEIHNKYLPIGIHKFYHAINKYISKLFIICLLILFGAILVLSWEIIIKMWF